MKNKGIQIGILSPGMVRTNFLTANLFEEFFRLQFVRVFFHMQP